MKAIGCVAQRLAAKSASVGGGEGVEGLFGLPAHVWVAASVPLFQDPDDTIAGHVEVEAGVGAVGRPVAGEGEPEGGVHAFFVEESEQLA